MKKIILCLTAYNNEKILAKTIAEAPMKIFSKAILVDDRSTDKTAAVAKKLGLKVISHSKRRGYGGAQKTLYSAALKARADIVVLLHADYQYSPKKIKSLIKPLVDGKADFTFGSRFANGADPRRGGMPSKRYYANKILTAIENFFLKTHFSELHSGFKAYTAGFLKSIPYKTYSDRFVFDSEMLFDAILAKRRVREVPIPTRYDNDSSSTSLKESIYYIGQTLIILFKRIFQAKFR